MSETTASSSARDRLARLTPAQKAALLARARESRRWTVPRREGPANEVPLSASQRRMLFGQLLDPEMRRVHTMSGVARIPGTLDLARLKRAADLLARRHEVLRTSYRLHDGRMVASVLPASQVQEGWFPVTDLGKVPSDQWEEFFAPNVREGLDPSAAPLARLWVAVHDDSTFSVQLVISHLTSDGFSTRVFFRDLAAFYAAGADSNLPELDYQFGDVAAHEQRTVDEDGQSLEWWAQRLAEAPLITSVPFDREPTGVSDLQAGRLEFVLPADLMTRVRRLARARGATPFAVVIAALSVVVHRWADQDDLVFGVPTANRSLPGSDELIGPFLNTLALRGRIDGTESFAKLVERWARAYGESSQHEACPFDAVVGRLAPRRFPGLPPVFQMLVNVEAESVAGHGEVAIDLRGLPSGFTDIPLSLRLLVGDGAAAGHVDFQRALYDEATIRTFLDVFRQVLCVGTANPEVSVDGLPLVAGSRDEHLRRGKAIRDSACPHESTPIEAVLAQAARTPQAMALTDGFGTRLTYAELEEGSGRIAGLLLEADVRPGNRVVVAMERSAEVILALHGVARVGAVAVPVDAGQPAARLRTIIEDAAPAAILVRQGASVELPKGQCRTIVANATPRRALRPGEVAAHWPESYLIFTSGTTGMPKGVLARHDGLLSLIRAIIQDTPVSRHARWLSVCSPAFDVAQVDYWVPFTLGHHLTVAHDEEVRDPSALARRIEQAQIDHLGATPTLWQSLRGVGWPGHPGLLAVVAGEPVVPSLAEWLLERTGTAVNAYGPTEATVYSHWHELRAEDAHQGAVPFGHPVPGSSYLLLDEHLNPVPRGFPGQLWIGGNPVTCGYWNRAELTEQRFRALIDGEGLFYGTGDIVYEGADGDLRFVGRSDDQIKIRGFRIELGEIEAALSAAPNVVEAAVAVTGEGSQRGLVGFVTGGLDGQQTPAWLRSVHESVAASVPGYMVPRRIQVLDHLPLSTSGKLDRKALAALADSWEQTDGCVTDWSAPSQRPLDDLEQQVLEIWKQVLSDPGLDADQDFFAAGGHSLLATELMFRIRETFDVELPLALLFNQRATARAMAQAVRSGGDLVSDSSEELDLQSDVRLDDIIVPGDLPRCDGRDPQHVLVTGITGFIGTFMAAELLETTDATLYGLVRAASRESGMKRIREALNHYGLWREEYAQRIVAVPGDLTRHRLGMVAPWWRHLCSWVDSVYHCAADVNFARSYAAMCGANADGVREILRLASTTTIKPVHMMSTIYVFDRFSHGEGVTYTEDLHPLHGTEFTFGYTQSKWVGEQIALEGRRRGLPVSIYRLGRVSGRISDGACQTYDLLWNATKVGLNIGMVPTMPMSLDITPVDWAIAAIHALSVGAGRHGVTYHVLNPRPVKSEDFARMVAQHGYTAEFVSFERWREAVLKIGLSGEDEAASALAPFLSGALPLDKFPSGPVDSSNVKRDLVGTGILCPPIDAQIVGRYLDYFVSIGFLPTCQDQAQRAAAQTAVRKDTA